VFINTNRPLGRPLPLTTATKEGKTAVKRKMTAPGQKRLQRKPRTKKVSEDLYNFQEIVSEDFWELVSHDNFWELVSHDNFWELVIHDNFCSFVNATAFGK